MGDATTNECMVGIIEEPGHGVHFPGFCIDEVRAVRQKSDFVYRYADEASGTIVVNDSGFGSL